jgi:hypothetical protein
MTDCLTTQHVSARLWWPNLGVGAAVDLKSVRPQGLSIATDNLRHANAPPEPDNALDSRMQFDTGERVLFQLNVHTLGTEAEVKTQVVGYQLD